jgi:hypothetical protein
MKKTIATVAILASTSLVQALAMPEPSRGGAKKAGTVEPSPHIICIRTSLAGDKSQMLGSCDETENNIKAKAKLQVNGCAAGQGAISTFANLNIPKCMPAGVVQL